MRHLQFSKGVYMFLEDLQKAEATGEEIEFSYKFKKNLKIVMGKPTLQIEEFKKVVETEIEEDLDRDDDNEYLVDYDVNTLLLYIYIQFDESEAKAISSIREEEEDKLQKFFN